jgi:Skp family chaperone for outer membrane proteins
MKKFITGALLLASQTLLFNLASAELNIMTVDVGSLYENYYKAKEAIVKIQDRFDTAKAQLDKMIADGEVEVNSYKTMVEQAQNPALSDSARQDAEKDADMQMEKIRNMQQEVQMFRQSTSNQLTQQQNTQRQFMLEEIKTVILEVAQQKKADLVFDTSTGISIGLPPVIFANPAWDTTKEVLAVLNADAPPESAATPKK